MTMIINNLKKKINFSTIFKLMAVFAVTVILTSCSKKVEIKGQITNGSPLERIEFIESSGVATLPLVNLGVDKDGKFEGSFDAPKDGMYIITYGGKQGTIYLKGGDKIEITGDAAQFPENYALKGDAKNNNDFIKNSQLFLDSYAIKIDMNSLILKDEAAFLKDTKKIKDDLFANLDETSKKFSADKSAIEWKKDELTTSLLGLLNQYEMSHGQAVQNPSFKVSKAFTDLKESLNADSDRLVQNHPQYRNYLLGTMGEDFQKYDDANNKDKKKTTSEVFSEYLKTKKDLSQTAKDYILAYVISQADLNMGTTKEASAKVTKIIDTEIKNADVKKDLKNIQFVLSGLLEGEALPDNSLIKADGSKFSLSELKGKPSLVMFYASWNPYISESSLPVLKEVVNFYKSKMNFTYVNLDDTKEQFATTSAAMFKGLPGTNAYVDGGINSDFAKKFGLYGFKLPGFLILDKDGKIAGKYFVNLGDPEVVTILDKLTGLKAPQVAPQEMPEIMPQMVPQETAPQEMPTESKTKESK